MSPCKHCWHIQGMIGASTVRPGSEHTKCCRCGEERHRDYILQRDPAHGSHVPIYVRVMGDGDPPTDGSTR